MWYVTSASNIKWRYLLLYESAVEGRVPLRVARSFASYLQSSRAMGRSHKSSEISTVFVWSPAFPLEVRHIITARGRGYPLLLYSRMPRPDLINVRHPRSIVIHSPLILHGLLLVVFTILWNWSCTSNKIAVPPQSIHEVLGASMRKTKTVRTSFRLITREITTRKNGFILVSKQTECSRAYILEA